jgi:hypothetical protein
METADQAVQHLYRQVQGTEYKPSAFWTTANKFDPAYKNVKSDFVLDTLKQLVPPKGIKPLSPRS